MARERIWLCSLCSCVLLRTPSHLQKIRSLILWDTRVAVGHPRCPGSIRGDYKYGGSHWIFSRCPMKRPKKLWLAAGRGKSSPALNFTKKGGCCHFDIFPRDSLLPKDQRHFVEIKILHNGYICFIAYSEAVLVRHVADKLELDAAKWRWQVIYIW